MISENKWRAIKNGVSSSLIDFGKQREINYSNLLEELVEFVDDVIDDLGSRKKIETLFDIMEKGTSADRQIEQYEKNENINDVVDSLIEETTRGC